MSVDRNHEVYIKAQSYVDTLSQLTAKERQTRPFAHFATDYNNLRSLAMELKKDLDPRSWPPEVAIGTSPGGAVAHATYADFLTYARQILGYFPLEPVMGIVA